MQAYRKDTNVSATINVFDIEPHNLLMSGDLEIARRGVAFADWVRELPDAPVNITLEYGMADVIPHRYTWELATDAQEIRVTTVMTDAFRRNILLECTDVAQPPEDDMPVIWSEGQVEAIMYSSTRGIVGMQHHLLEKVADAVGWDIEESLRAAIDRGVDPVVVTEAITLRTWAMSLAAELDNLDAGELDEMEMAVVNGIVHDIVGTIANKVGAL